MSFLDKIKKLGKREAAEADALAASTQAASDIMAGTGRPESSIIAEARPTEFVSGPFTEANTSFASTTATVDADPAAASKPAAGQRRQGMLTALVAAGLIGTVAMVGWALVDANRSAAQARFTGQALMQSQRMAKAVSAALLGNTASFGELRESVEVLEGLVPQLREGGGGAEVQQGLDDVEPLLKKADTNGRAVLAQQKVLTQVGQALKAINKQSGELLESAEAVVAQAQGYPNASAEVAAAGQLLMLTQRIGKSANEFLTQEGVSPDAVFLLSKDLGTFKQLGEGMLKGNADLRLPPARDAQMRERIGTLLKQFEATREQADLLQSNLQGLVAAREAQNAILADSEPLRKGLEGIAAALESAGGLSLVKGLLLAASLAALAFGAVGFLRLYVSDQAQRAQLAEEQKREAEAQEREAKRVNDANQAAILRLMNELQAVAEGDLTQQATVTEDITGAIADSVNYTVEELRNLVGQVQSTAARVTDTTGQVDQTSTELLAASTEQLHEIRATGEAVLRMAGRINEVSAQAQHTAEVARQSRQAAEGGREAVQNNIGGMVQIRESIQETSKRIKRLGESSQEIGEITELISDITEQTNVLALNAAIQAASAGEAGRGFSVVAEEVQRLAERSGDATRRIAALVKTIQTDTQDAVAAMERSTVGVVQGTKLSDAAGSALEEIDRVSRQLDQLIAEISSQALREAQAANEVAANIQHIFAVTEQTSEGTRSTAQMVHELSRSAEALRQSVARFKVS
jgi:twitching motility protein PilJ